MVWSPALLIDAALSAIHILTFGLGLAAIFLRGRALAGVLDAAGWKRLLTADTAWGVAAVLWILTGLARVFLGPKDPVFYWRNGFFWIKMTLFLAVFVLELTPMRTFMRARQAAGRLRASGASASQARGAAMPVFDAARYRRINTIEMALVLVIPFAAALMARGAWLF
jgi:putative membrane protein